MDPVTLLVALRSIDCIVLASDVRGWSNDGRYDDRTGKTSPASASVVSMYAGDIDIARGVLHAAHDRYTPPNGVSIDEDPGGFARALHEAACRTYMTSYGEAWESAPLLAFVVAGFRMARQSCIPTPIVYLLHSADRFVPRAQGARPILLGVPAVAEYLATMFNLERLHDAFPMQVAAMILVKESHRVDSSVSQGVRITTLTPGAIFSQLSGEDEARVEAAADLIISGLRSGAAGALHGLGT